MCRPRLGTAHATEAPSYQSAAKIAAEMPDPPSTRSHRSPRLCLGWPDNRSRSRVIWPYSHQSRGIELVNFSHAPAQWGTSIGIGNQHARRIDRVGRTPTGLPDCHRRVSSSASVLSVGRSWS